jgi:hypothetical protein
MAQVDVQPVGRISVSDMRGLTYTLVERLHIERRTLPDRSVHRVPLGKTYRTLSGEPVTRETPDVFRMSCSGAVLKRISDS